jgi:hypothetical protein
MATQPRMGAPIGRVRVRTSEDRARRGSGTGRWKTADPPVELELSEADEARDDDSRPRFYPFPLRRSNPRDE